MWSWDTQSNSHAQRKFIELIFDRTGKYPNWDPPSEIPVGSYGRIDKATGNLIPQGSIYSDDFKHYLVDAGVNFESGEHLPEDCPEESELTTWSKNVKRIESNVESQASVPEIATAAIKGTWQVKKGTTGALARIQLLQSMHLVTKAFYCPAFSMYLSDTSGGSFSIALLGSAPIVAPVGTANAVATMRWWSDAQSGLTRNGCMTEHCFTPLYELLHVRHPRNRRSSPSPVRTGEMLWIAPPVPWAPLREDGTEVPIYINDNTDSSDDDSESE
ncbi:hypothetical protein F4604DRAFT_1748776 [Suillus subluteus]|nr:hypothetical protein F4604DRAFT_1748776 [Suillus subluteus]